MNIEKNTHDKNYPYTITDSWGSRLPCSKRDLEELRMLIDHALEKESAKPTTCPTPRVPSYGSIGGQMVRKMIEAYEGRMNND